MFLLYKKAAESKKTFAFIGIIGSKSKASAIKLELQKSGVDEKFLENLHIPLGLSLGNNDPAEIGDKYFSSTAAGKRPIWHLNKLTSIYFITLLLFMRRKT